MVNCIVYIVKLLQFLTAIGIFVVFVIPQKLNVDTSAINKNVTDAFFNKIKLRPVNLFCSHSVEDLQEDSGCDLECLAKIINLKKGYVLRNGTVMVKVAKCYRDATDKENLDAKCFCLGSFYMVAPIILSVTAIVYCAVDCIVICASTEESDTVHGWVAITVATFTVIAWATIGAIVMYFIFLKWPFVYFSLKNDVPKHFFSPSIFYWIGAGLCCFYVVLASVECVTYVVLNLKNKKKNEDDNDKSYSQGSDETRCSKVAKKQTRFRKTLSTVTDSLASVTGGKYKDKDKDDESRRGDATTRRMGSQYPSQLESINRPQTQTIASKTTATKRSPISSAKRSPKSSSKRSPLSSPKTSPSPSTTSPAGSTVAQNRYLNVSTGKK